jgi:N-acetylmuramoyl-L-alanine amidase
MTFLLLTLLLWFNGTPAHASEKFHQVEALPNETALKLLQRYNLEQYQCNIDQFSKLNDVNPEALLVQGNKYFIPVLLYDYDGKSIRSTLGIKDWEQAVRIKKFNDAMLQQKLRRQTIVDSRILWVPYHELNCIGARPIVGKPTSRIVESNISGTRRFPIFGPDYEKVPLVDNKLRGKVYYIVGGHGGPDSGAVGKKGNKTLCEDEYAYDVCLRLARKLLEHGATPYMIIRDPDDGIRDGKYLDCDRDEYCWGNYQVPRSQKNRLFQRSNAINELYEKNRKAGVTEQYVITIHVDSRQKGERTDVFFYHHPDSKEGKICAEKIQKALAKKYARYRKYGSYQGTVSGRNLHMLREVKPTSVFIELGNIRNPYDQLRFILKSNRQYLADWIFEGILQF